MKKKKRTIKNEEKKTVGLYRREGTREGENGNKVTIIKKGERDRKKGTVIKKGGAGNKVTVKT